MPTTASAAAVERALWSLQAYDTTALATVSDAGPRVGGAFFVPERTSEGIRLVIAQLRDSRALNDMALDPRVAFICSPGNPARWIQGTGIAEVVVDEALTSLDQTYQPKYQTIGVWDITLCLSSDSGACR